MEDELPCNVFDVITNHRWQASWLLCDDGFISLSLISKQIQNGCTQMTTMVLVAYM